MQTTDPILYPVLAMLLLTAAVAAIMTIYRMKIVRANLDQVDSMANRHTMAPYITGLARRASDNFNNLLETPILFYVLCLAIMISGLTDNIYLWLAWAYVVLRGVHSIVHCSYNNMAHRGIVFAMATTCMLLMLGKVIIDTLPW